jgi:2-phosphosulfolactate phosphatase
VNLRVDVLPRTNDEAGSYAFTDTVLVIDTLRATTAAATYLERGAKALYLCADLETARGFRGAGFILAGERNCLPPEDFDLGNSPVQASSLDFTDQTVVMSTSNGTLAASLACETGRQVLLASLRNAHAAARKAREVATEEIAILCAGAGGRVGLEDIYTAGVLCEYLLAMGEWQLDDGAQVALTVRRQFADPLEPLGKSRAAELIIQAGLEFDITFAAEVSRSTVVPTFCKREGAALVFQ